MSDTLKHIAKCLKAYRASKNLSQEELAALAGLDRTYISGIERGVRNITINSINKIICALDITWETFLLSIIKSLNDEKKGE